MMFHLEAAAADSFVADSFLQITSERVCSQGANDEWGVFVFKSVGRPFGKLSEVVQKDCFYLVLAGRLGRSGDIVGQQRHKTPNAKHQSPEKLQAPGAGTRCTEIGVLGTAPTTNAGKIG